MESFIASFMDLQVLLIVIVVFPAATTAPCQFSRLFNNSSQKFEKTIWKGTVTNQNRRHDLLMQVENAEITFTWLLNQTQFQWFCISQVQNCFLVDEKQAHIQRTTDTTEEQVIRRFCVQLVVRGGGVVQLGEFAHQGNTCHTTPAIQLNPWLFISETLLVQQACSPLKGGFHARVFRSNEHVRSCPLSDSDMRIESECLRGDGMTFYSTCILAGLFADKMQKASCLASWQQETFKYIVLKQERLPLIFLFRIPFFSENSFTGHVFVDLFVDDGEQPSRNHFRVDLVRDTSRPATSLCTDELDTCTDARGSCSTEWSVVAKCMRTCRLCNATRPTICNFKTDLFGRWTDGSPNGATISINGSQLTVESLESNENYRCISWGSQRQDHRNKFFEDTMMVSEHFDGCKTRYVCMRVLRKSSSVVLFKFSHPLTWPLTSSMSEEIDCLRLDMNQEKHPPSIHFKMFFSQQTRDAVHCNLPSDLNNFYVFHHNRTKCRTLFQLRTEHDFRFSCYDCVPNSGDLFPPMSFTCLDSSHVLPSNNLFVVTKESSGVVYCWLFVQEFPHSVSAFYLVDSENCEPASKGYMFKPRAVFCKVNSASLIFRMQKSKCNEFDANNEAKGVESTSLLMNDNRVEVAPAERSHRYGLITKRTAFFPASNLAQKHLISHFARMVPFIVKHLAVYF